MKLNAVLIASSSVALTAAVPADPQHKALSKVLEARAPVSVGSNNVPRFQPPQAQGLSSRSILYTLWQRAIGSLDRAPISEPRVQGVTDDKIKDRPTHSGDKMENASPQYKEGVEHAKKVAEAAVAKYPKWSLKTHVDREGNDNAPPKGSDSRLIFDKDGHAHYFIGEDQPGGALNMHIHQRINGYDPAKGMVYKRVDSDKEKDTNRGVATDKAATDSEIVKDEKTFASFQQHYGDERLLVSTLPVDPHEQSREGNFLAEIRRGEERFNADPANKGKDFKVEVIVNLSDGTRSKLLKDLQSGKWRLLIGPEHMNKVHDDFKGMPDAELTYKFDMGSKDVQSTLSTYQTLPMRPAGTKREASQQDRVADVSAPTRKSERTNPGQGNSGATKRDLVMTKKLEKKHLYGSFGSASTFQKRGDIFEAIDDTEENTDPTIGWKDDIEYYAAVKTYCQRNVTDLIWPVITNITTQSDSVAVYGMALSIWAQLTGAPIAVSTPYYYGYSRLPEMEEALVKNGTSEEKMSTVYQTDALLDSMYEWAWTEASELANSTGLLADIAFLNELLVPDDKTLLPDWYLERSNSAAPYETFAPRENRFVSWDDYSEITGITVNDTSIWDFESSSASSTQSKTNTASTATGTLSTATNTLSTAETSLTTQISSLSLSSSATTTQVTSSTAATATQTTTEVAQ